MENGLHLYSAFLTSGHSKHLITAYHPHVNTPTALSTKQGNSLLVGSQASVRVRCLVRGQLDTQLGGEGNPTSHPPLPPELLPPDELLQSGSACLMGMYL